MSLKASTYYIVCQIDKRTHRTHPYRIQYIFYNIFLCKRLTIETVIGQLDIVNNISKVIGGMCVHFRPERFLVGLCRGMSELYFSEGRHLAS